ncbi:hypothetical protein BDK89_1003 [Ilumatobacter fluminis]|uniref:Uncharacterized protein n=1 Tax=Ilumatobacter fluminis TaxID=467091 RepID=A0A4R7HZ51_9ACTN|nr:hypothetical protein [Ilumatobacter fluminis]TDT15433.1 hypothetical protein BDK89_1003 [Ilumatobacter fluminis]
MPFEHVSVSESTLDRVVAAIVASWSNESSASPDDWSLGNPAKGQCEVSSFVAWELLGGELVLGHVYAGTDFQEYHYWNRIDGADLDLTRRQFVNGETITEVDTLTSAFIEANRADMRPELAQRIDVLRVSVAERLGAS